jgi:two-component system nitrogen regulation sensor histidine kinase GlnL
MQKGILVEASYDPSLPDIEADEDQLIQVFLNLIKNAMEASAKDSKIRLTTRFSGHFAVLSSVDRSPTQNIIVEITDFGCGIEDEKLDKLFTPFFTSKPKGSGMGLPICLKIIENHHGKIKITSKKNAGTTVQVFLPVRQG